MSKFELDKKKSIFEVVVAENIFADDSLLEVYSRMAEVDFRSVLNTNDEENRFCIIARCCLRIFRKYKNNNKSLNQCEIVCN